MLDVRIHEIAWKIKDGSEVMYLVIDRFLAEKYEGLIHVEPEKEFYQFIAENMNAIMNGKEIASEIEPTIMNLVDDKMSGRKMALRAGDYIALQRAFRGKTARKSAK